MLTKEDILNAKDIKEKTITVPEWGGEVKIKSLTSLEKDRIESFIFNESRTAIITEAEVKARYLVYSIITEDGKRMFTDLDAKELGKKSAAAVDRVFMALQEICAISDSDVEKMAKN